MFYPQQLDIRYCIRSSWFIDIMCVGALGHRIVYSLPWPINLSFQEMPVPTELPSPTSPAEDEALFFRKFLMVHGIRWPEKSRSGYNKCETYSDILPVGTCSSKLLHEDISANTWVSFEKGRCNETCSRRGEVMFPRVYVIWVSLIFCISAIHLQVLHNSMPVFSLMIPEGI